MRKSRKGNLQSLCQLLRKAISEPIRSFKLSLEAAMANCSRLYVVEKLLPIFRRRFTQILKMIKNSQDIMSNLDLLKNIEKKKTERETIVFINYNIIIITQSRLLFFFI